MTIELLTEITKYGTFSMMGIAIISLLALGFERGDWGAKLFYVSSIIYCCGGLIALALGATLQ